MIIERLIINNYKTYVGLDMDLSITKQCPIILIGGANGGGKTTLFQAITGALFGLNITKKEQFRALVNAANATPIENQDIKLAIHFSNAPAEKVQQYSLERKYIYLNGRVREHVRFVGNRAFEYGPETPKKTKEETEEAMNKVIQANLPKSLAGYFLFDAMVAGNLLRTEKLKGVIKDNIEQVMGFDRYLQLERATDMILDTYKQEQIKEKEAKKVYQKRLRQKENFKKELFRINKRLNVAKEYAANHFETYESLQEGQNQNDLFQQSIARLKKEIASIQDKENQYVKSCTPFLQQLDSYLGLPILAAALGNKIQILLKQQKEQTNAHLKRIITTKSVEQTLAILKERNLLKELVQAKDIIAILLQKEKTAPAGISLTSLEIMALKKVLVSKNTPYPSIAQQQKDLIESYKSKEKHTKKIEDYQSKLSKKDFSLLQAYEKNIECIRTYEKELIDVREGMKKLEEEMKDFEQVNALPLDEKKKELQHLKRYFGCFAVALLAKKKANIEQKMKAELNQMLGPYKGKIDRVVLPKDLKNLTFKLYHTNGNELHLEQLNTASKQIVVQCLLKALHDSGSYTPPVMIDTVMGVLDEQSRATMLDYFLPNLSHQIILLSSDSEIRPGNDLAKIEPYVAKKYTLQRNIDKQQTNVLTGYFNQ